MATVVIGGRSLPVRVDTLGFIRNTVLPWKKRMREASTDEEVLDLSIEGILHYVGHNEGVDAAFVLEHVRESDVRSVFEACKTAAGYHETQPGEAKSP